MTRIRPGNEQSVNISQKGNRSGVPAVLRTDTIRKEVLKMSYIIMMILGTALFVSADRKAHRRENSPEEIGKGEGEE